MTDALDKRSAIGLDGGERLSDDQLRRIAANIRMRDVRMIRTAGAGHIGGDLSMTDILTVLYFSFLRVDPARPNWSERDRFILSKGHAAGALYATLAAAGFIDDAELDTFMRPESRLNGHPSLRLVPGVEANTGPLGHGLPIAVGMALAARLRQSSARTVVLAGDGELQEGSNWEAAMAAAHFELDHLTLFIDRNGLQQGAATEKTMALDPLPEKWRAFRWGVVEVDGHDIPSLRRVLAQLPVEAGKPTCIIAHTHKGQGVSFMRDKVEWHHRVPTAEEAAVALQELEASAR
jgi:transketolase